MSEKQDQLARKIWESRNDPEEWSEEAEDIKVQPKSSTVVSFRLQEDELDDVEEAMEQTGETLSQFIRGAINMRLHSASLGSGLRVLFVDSTGPLSMSANPRSFLGGWNDVIVEPRDRQLHLS